MAASAITPVSGDSDRPDPKMRDLLEFAFNNVQSLVTSEESARLFPNGMESLDLEVGSDSDFRLSLKIRGAQAPAAAEGAAAPAEGPDIQPFFNAEGHHVIALIAMQDLEQRAPAAMLKVQKILDDGGRTVEQAATFPDEIRQQQPATKPFHFIDIPFTDGGPANPSLPPAPHAVSKIADFTQVLSQHGGSAQEQVDALSWLLHLFGDIHQPLHCIEHTSALHPHGDQGGNAFQLRGKFHNLHSLWDSSIDISVHKIEVEMAADIAQEHPRSQFTRDLGVTQAEAWARASYTLAKANAYGPLLPERAGSPPTPSPAYLKNVEKIGRRQAALAGYRLSDRLRQIFG